MVVEVRMNTCTHEYVFQMEMEEHNLLFLTVSSEHVNHWYESERFPAQTTLMRSLRGW